MIPTSTKMGTRLSVFIRDLKVFLWLVIVSFLDVLSAETSQCLTVLFYPGDKMLLFFCPAQAKCLSSSICWLCSLVEGTVRKGPNPDA